MELYSGTPASNVKSIEGLAARLTEAGHSCRVLTVDGTVMKERIQAEALARHQQKYKGRYKHTFSLLTTY